jgi:hypothetical protein
VTVTLYTPTAHYKQSSEGFDALQTTPFAEVPPQAAALLGCTYSLVDVLANGPGFVVYTIFDSEEAANPGATQAVSALTGTNFDVTNEDELLRGPVLIIQAQSS